MRRSCPGCLPPSVPGARIVVGVDVSIPFSRLQLGEHRFRNPVVRVRDAAGDREVTRDEPRDPAGGSDGERDRDPGGRCGALRGFVFRAPGGAVVLRAVRRAAATGPSLARPPLYTLVGLLLFGHPGGYGRRDVREERVIGVDLGGNGNPRRPRRAGRHDRPHDRDRDAGRRRRRRYSARSTASSADLMRGRRGGDRVRRAARTSTGERASR